MYKICLQYKCLFYLLFSQLLLQNIAFAGTSNRTYAFKVGTLATESTQAFPGVKSSSALIVLEGNYYSGKSGISLGMNRAGDSESDRTLYQAAAIGWNYFLFDAPIPQNYKVGNKRISYDYSLSPYFQLGLGIGHAILSVVGNQNAYQAASDFFGIRFGLGSLYKITDSIALDFGFVYESASGFNSPWSYAASSNLIMIGTHFYM